MKVLDNDQWVSQQFVNCQFGDKRLTSRLKEIATNMLSAPEKSIVEQNVEWADVKAAYRFFDNDQVTFAKVADQHWQQTRQTKPGRYLLISDTTDIDHTSHKATSGLGILGDGVGRGMQLHSCLMYNVDENLLEGAAGSLIYYRKLKPKGETRTQRLARNRESDIWGILVDTVGRAPDGSKWIHVFDRGGDNFEAMCHIRLTDNDWVIRASRLTRSVINENGKRVPLKNAIKHARKLGSYELNLRSRPDSEARTAKMEILTVKVTYVPPKLHSQWVKKCGIRELPMNVVIVQEVDAPKGVKPIRWVLLTSLPVETLDDAWQIVEYYESRWMIEISQAEYVSSAGLYQLAA